MKLPIPWEQQQLVRHEVIPAVFTESQPTRSLLAECLTLVSRLAPKCWLTFIGLQGIVSSKTQFQLVYLRTDSPKNLYDRRLVDLRAYFKVMPGISQHRCQEIKHGHLIRFCCFVVGVAGGRGSIVVEALCYMPEGRGFETRWGEWTLSVHLMVAAVGPRAYSAPNINSIRSKVVREADNLSAICEPTVWTMWNP
jgi:hypothetical protein